MQTALARMIKSQYGLPVVDMIDNVSDTGVATNQEWIARGGDAIDVALNWTHCIAPYPDVCSGLTCELGNPSNPDCCQEQWAMACPNPYCRGAEGTCAWGLNKLLRDRQIAGESTNIGAILQAFEMLSYNNAHMPTAEQMYEEGCRILTSGVADLFLWYDWDKSYSGYTKDIRSNRYDQFGGDRWEAMRRVYDDCAIKPSGTVISDPTSTPTQTITELPVAGCKPCPGKCPEFP